MWVGVHVWICSGVCSNCILFWGQGEAVMMDSGKGWAGKGNQCHSLQVQSLMMAGWLGFGLIGS